MSLDCWLVWVLPSIWISWSWFLLSAIESFVLQRHTHTPKTFAKQLRFHVMCKIAPVHPICHSHNCMLPWSMPGFATRAGDFYFVKQSKSSSLISMNLILKLWISRAPSSSSLLSLLSSSSLSSSSSSSSSLLSSSSSS